MPTVSEILKTTAHRPFKLPVGPWRYYQEWNNAIFFHWQVPFELLRELVPHKLELDSFNGQFYVSLVAFTMQKIRPRYLPSISFVSEFNEINLRTYVNYNGKQGVFFLNIEAAKFLSVLLAKWLSGLPYEKAVMKRTDKSFISKNTNKYFYFDVSFDVEEPIVSKEKIDKWLTERYCLYLAKGNDIFCYDIQHKEWPLRRIAVRSLNFKYKVGKIDLFGQPPFLAQYSDRVSVLAWDRYKI
jgi:uncharacterized protein